MNVKCLALSCNCYIVSDQNNNAVVFDPAERGQELYNYIKERGLSLEAVIITHAHFDHIFGLTELVDATLRDEKNIPVYVHTLDAEALRNKEKNLSSPLFRTPYEYTGTLCEVNDGDVVKVGAMSFEVMSSPGHTQGSACYVCHKERTVFSGDVLFEGSIGRTDFPGGDMSKMRQSLARLMELDEAYIVYPGHGSSTTVGDEKNFNPYIASL